MSELLRFRRRPLDAGLVEGLSASVLVSLLHFSYADLDGAVTGNRGPPPEKQAQTPYKYESYPFLQFVRQK
ncbi:hypothetical protein MTO96_001201 [Rhipicephalus appendiculatus]